MSIDITTQFQYVWGIAREIWLFLDSYTFTIGNISFTWFDLNISILAFFIIFGALKTIFLFDWS